MAIAFHSLVSSFKLKNAAKVSKFIQLLVYLELHEVGDIQYIFCSDSYLLKLNKQFLKHSTLTDIITFDYSNSDIDFAPQLSGSFQKKNSSSRKLNKKHAFGNTQNLKHGTILTGDIFISFDRVVENALLFKQPLNRELMRVIIHGALHLCGYKDKLPAHKKKMRAKEDYYLELWEQGV